MGSSPKKRERKRVVVRLGDIVPDRMARGGMVLGNLVEKTYGPTGGTVLLDRSTGLLASSDGYMISQEVGLRDPIADIGVKIVKNGAREVNVRTGDGTSTSMLITRGALREGRKLLAAGWEPQDLGRAMETMDKIFMDALKAQTLTPDRAALHGIGLNASHGDNLLAEKVTEAVMTCGEGGTILVSPGQSTGIELEVRDGLKLDAGWVTSEMGHGETERVLESVLVVLYPRKLITMEDVAPFLEEAGNRELPVLLVCCGVYDQARAVMLLNDQKGIVSSVAVNLAPRGWTFFEEAMERMGDVAAMTGGTVVDPLAGMDISKFESAWFGTARKVAITQSSCTIWGYQEHEEKVDQRISYLREMATRVAAEGYTHDRDDYLTRAASLDGGLVTLKVGGFTESEARERRGRAEDAVRATQGALTHGVVPGAGVSLMALLELCPQNLTGRILRAALTEPFLTLCLRNGGVLPGRAYSNSPWMAYDPVQQEERDFRQLPLIMDSFEVIREALRTGLSSAVAILSCGAAIHGKHR